MCSPLTPPLICLANQAGVAYLPAEENADHTS